MKDHELYGQCDAVQADFIELWEKIVNIDTGTGYGQGINQVAQLVADFLQEIGATVQVIPTANPAQGSHVVGVFKGKGTGKILSIAHLDTVFSEGTAKQRPFCIKDGWAHGPGVADCKGSVVLCLFAAKLLRQLQFDRFDTITMLFNCDEEIGSPDSRPLIEQLAQAHDYTFCMEPGREGDGVIIWRKGISEIKLEVFGKASHAGSNPTDGVNAITEIIHQIQQMSALEYPEKHTTVNFTTVQSGSQHNVIPNYALAYADVRSIYSEEFERIDQMCNALAKKTIVPGARVQVTLEPGNPPFAQNKGSNELIAIAQEVYKELGKSLGLVGSGGVSDANWAAAVGASVLDALGPVQGGKLHSEAESSEVASVVPRLYLLVRLLQRLGEKS